MTSSTSHVESTLQGSQILIGISGGIACYKTAFLVSSLAQMGAAVDVVMTESATRFIAPLTFESLTGRPVFDSPWKHVDGHEPQHIKLAQRAKAMLIAPCTMDLLATLVQGFAHDPVSLVCSAINRSNVPVLLAPSMNETMYGQPSTQRNLQCATDDGFTVLDAEDGWQACRAEGKGRMPETETLIKELEKVIISRN